jgi:hypothetical protein
MEYRLYLAITTSRSTPNQGISRRLRPPHHWPRTNPHLLLYRLPKSTNMSSPHRDQRRSQSVASSVTFAGENRFANLRVDVTSVTNSIPSRDYTKAFKVKVGGQTFILYRDTVCNTSKHFKNAAEASPAHWETNDTMLLKLLGFDSLVFDVYADWVNTKKLVVKGFWWDLRVGWNPEHHFHKTCVEAYILGDHLGDVAFQQSVLDAMLTLMPGWRFHLGRELIVRIWTVKLKDSLLKTIVMRWALNRFNEDFVTTMAGDVRVPREFFSDLASAAIHRINRTNGEENQIDLRALAING